MTSRLLLLHHATPPPLKGGARSRWEAMETEKTIFQLLAWQLTWNSSQWIQLGDHAQTPNLLFSSSRWHITDIEHTNICLENAFSDKMYCCSAL